MLDHKKIARDRMKFTNKKSSRCFPLRPRSFRFPPLALFDLCNYLPRWLGMCDASRQPRYGSFWTRDAAEKKEFRNVGSFSLRPPTTATTTTHLGRENIEFFRSPLIKSSISYTLCPKRARFFIWKFRSMCASRVDLPRMYFPSASLYIAEALTARARAFRAGVGDCGWLV